jgi:6-pyruvoyltetrahydropterin/6-carboxytetrahydropterin synthase
MVIEKKYHFYAAHRNKNAGEKCGRIHGHTYEVKCYFKFNQINEGGVTYLFSDIDKLVEPIIKDYCHWFLIYEKDPLVNILELANEPIKKLPFETSAENMSIWLFSRIKNETKLPIIKIELAETKSSNVIYEINS